MFEIEQLFLVVLQRLLDLPHAFGVGLTMSIVRWEFLRRGRVRIGGWLSCSGVKLVRLRETRVGERRGQKDRDTDSKGIAKEYSQSCAHNGFLTDADVG